MKNHTHISSSLSGASPLTLRQSARVFLLATAMLLLLLSAQNIAFAGSATWKTSPGSGDWNTAANWIPSIVPNGSPGYSDLRVV